MSSFSDIFGKKPSKPSQGAQTGFSSVFGPQPPQFSQGSGAGFDFTNLTPGEQQRFDRLNNQFQGLVIGDDPNFKFDINKYNNDPAFRELVQQRIARDPDRALNKQKSLDDLLDFFEQRPGGAQGFKDIDLGAIFDPLKSEIDKLSAQGLQGSKQALSQAGRGAERTASEALAGTGLGRSGVAANTFGEIGRQKVESLERITSQAEQSRQAAQLDLEFKKASLQYSEALAERGFTQGQMQDALEFDKQLFMMQFQSDLARQEQEAASGGFGGFLADLGALAGGASGFFNPIDFPGT